jgi:hypothetical protein
MPINGGDNVSYIESQLTSLDDDPEGRAIEEAEKFGILDTFYNENNSKFLKHTWDAKKAHIGEFGLLTDRLLSMVRGSSGTKRDGHHKVIIAIGLGKFGTHTNLPSLHTSFLSYFTTRARSLDYLVVGINEFYTSKRCPTCQRDGIEKEDFVGRVTTRRLFCDECHNPFHRDILAASNMVVAVRSHLIANRRPPYLRPLDKYGHYLSDPGDDSDDSDDDGDGSDDGDNAPGGPGSSDDNGDYSDDEDDTPRPSRGRATTSATKRKRAHGSPSSPGPRPQKKSVRHTSSEEDEPTWTGHRSSSSTSRVPKRKTSTEPESAEPRHEKGRQQGKGSKRHQMSLVPACADRLPKASRKLQSPACLPHRVLHIRRPAATILLLPSSQDPAPDENKRDHTFTRTHDG